MKVVCIRKQNTKANVMRGNPERKSGSLGVIWGLFHSFGAPIQRALSPQDKPRTLGMMRMSQLLTKEHDEGGKDEADHPNRKETERSMIWIQEAEF